MIKLSMFFLFMLGLIFPIQVLADASIVQSATNKPVAVGQSQVNFRIVIPEKLSVISSSNGSNFSVYSNSINFYLLYGEENQIVHLLRKSTQNESQVFVNNAKKSYTIFVM